MTEQDGVHLSRVAEAKAQLNHGKSVEDILVSLRTQGATAMETIKVIRAVTNISLHDAKELIHNSVAWSDIGEAMAETNEQLYREIEKIGERISVDGQEYIQIRLKKD